MKKKILYGGGSDFNLVFFSFLSYVEKKFTEILIKKYQISN
jgi:hypothetical protein